MDYNASMKFVRISPTKVNRVAGIIRGKTVATGLELLRFIPHRGARLLEKVLRSAAANAEDLGVRSVNALVILHATVNSGPTLKRIQPHARGMGFLIKKRTSHIKITVSTGDRPLHDVGV